jgi:hypothetical protein
MHHPHTTTRGPALALWASCALCLAACVPRERAEDEQAAAEPQHKAPRTTAVASREEVPENLPLSKADASAASARPKPPSRPGTNAAIPRPTVAPQQAPSAAAKTPNGADPLLTAAFQDDFSRPELGPDWHSTSPRWKSEGGKLCVSDARNHPLWLKRRLPSNARIEFSATSYSDDGDIKVEIWGDGRSAASGASYNDATGYLTIFGGWKNKFHVLARLDEHAPKRPEIKIVPDGDDPRGRPVENGVEYTFKIERADGKTVRWLVDDIELFAFSDPAPLVGAGHDHFGFNNWQVKVCFDNLKILPLPSP